MVNRRTFMTLLATAAVAPDFSWAQGGGGNRVALYASVGPTLTHYDVDVAGMELSRRSSVTLPANVQYAWPHASRQYLYVASSNSSPGLGGVVGDKHHVSAFRLDGSGALMPHGQPIPLPSRPIHLTTDRPSEYVLVAFNNPSAIRVYRINRDATLGEEVQQSGSIDAGIFAHQVRVTDSNRLAILVTRGNDRAGEKPEDPGALKVFNFRDGRLTNGVSVAPNGGYGFGPRHLDFHPSKPWVYVSLERENKLDMFTLDGDTLAPVPRSEAIAAIGSDRDRVGEQSILEVEHLERPWVFGLATHGVIAARHEDRQPVVGSHAHLMREYPGVDGPRLLHFLAECRVAIDAVDSQGARIVERNEHVLGWYIGRQVNWARGQRNGLAVRRQRTGSVDAKGAHVMLVADYPAQPGRAVTRCHIEILPRHMRPHVLHIRR